jgi:trigger factor
MDHPAQPDEIVVADYWWLDEDGKMEKGSKTSNYPFDLSSESLLKEFKDALVGAKKGDAKTVEVTYPEDFAEEGLRGKKASFGVEVKKVGRLLLPQVNDEFAKTLGAETALVLRMKVREGLEGAARQEAASRAKREILNTIIQESEFDVPEGLVNMALESMMRSYREEYGEKQGGGTEEKLKEIRERLRPLAVNIVKEQYIIDDIAEREEITVEDEEIEELIKTLAQRTGVSVEEARRRTAESEDMGRWRRDILRNKVFDFLMENAEVET